MPTTLSINVPFEGFYESKLSSELDHVEEREAEYAEEREAEEQPEGLRLTASEIAEQFYWVTDYHSAYEQIAREWSDSFNDVASEEIGFPLGLTFEEMTSPKEYNFTTDRIFMRIPVKSAAKLFAVSHRESHARLAACIKERFTSRDGFISFYSNKLADWLAKPLPDWDANELGTLLRAMLPDEERGEGLDWQVYYKLAEGECFYDAFQSAVDWPKFEERCNELREKKREAIAADNPEHEFLPPRCSETVDMFTGQKG